MASLPHIYLITNNINGKVYVGQTNGNHKYYYSGGVIIEKALRKYGKDSFTREVLIQGNFNRKQLDWWEIYFISFFSANDRRYGYNKLSGGVGGRGLSHTPESIEKITVRSRQDDNRIRIREIQKLAAKKRIGMHHKKESKIQGTVTKFGKRRIIEIYNKDGSLFSTCDFQPEAVTITGVKRAAISNNLAGISKSCRNFTFKYKEVSIGKLY